MIIKLVFVTNPDFDTAYSKEKEKKNIELTGPFSVVKITDNVNEALTAAANYSADALILRPASRKSEYDRQIKAISSFVKKSGDNIFANIIILSDSLCKKTARQLSNAHLMYHFMASEHWNTMAASLNKLFRCNHKLRAEEQENSEDKLRVILSSIGINPAYNGYRYLIDAVILINSLDSICSVTKEIYPDIASLYGKSVSSVEKAIRFMIDSAWCNVKWPLHFPELKEKPSNKEFLLALAKNIKLAKKIK